MDEREAIQRLKQGHIQGLEILVTNYQTQALRAANMIVHDRSRAEDIVQAVFVRVYRQIGSFDLDRPFRPWFIRMVVNEALRTTTGREDLSLEMAVWDGDDSDHMIDLLPDQHGGPEYVAEETELRQTVWGALSQLIPQERAVITLRYYLDYSEQEMAETLNCPPGTVKWRLHEARQHLRTLLQPLWAHNSASANQAGEEVK